MMSLVGRREGWQAKGLVIDHTVRAWELSTDPGSLDLPASASGGARLGGLCHLPSPVSMPCVPEGSGTQMVKVSSAMGKMAQPQIHPVLA